MTGTTRSGWCLPTADRDCYDHGGCRVPETCGCPRHGSDEQ